MSWVKVHVVQICTNGASSNHLLAIVASDRPWATLSTCAHWQNLKADWIYSTKRMMMLSYGWKPQRLQHSRNEMNWNAMQRSNDAWSASLQWCKIQPFTTAMMNSSTVHHRFDSALLQWCMISIPSSLKYRTATLCCAEIANLQVSDHITTHSIRCGLQLQMWHGLCVCWTHWSALQKQPNRSGCCLGQGPAKSNEPCTIWGTQSSQGKGQSVGQCDLMLALLYQLAINNITINNSTCCTKISLKLMWKCITIWYAVINRSATNITEGKSCFIINYSNILFRQCRVNTADVQIDLANKLLMFVAKKQLRKAVVNELNVAVVSHNNKSTHCDVHSHCSTVAGCRLIICNIYIEDKMLTANKQLRKAGVDAL